jgi:hypothetical protein
MTKKQNAFKQEIWTLIRDLSLRLDMDVYIPVKEELEKCRITYSLGNRKEDYKKYLQERVLQLVKSCKKEMLDKQKVREAIFLFTRADGRLDAKELKKELGLK